MSRILWALVAVLLLSPACDDPASSDERDGRRADVVFVGWTDFRIDGARYHEATFENRGDATAHNVRVAVRLSGGGYQYNRQTNPPDILPWATAYLRVKGSAFDPRPTIESIRWD